MKLLASTFVSIVIVSATASAATSIVGKWDFPENKCKFPIKIGAMSMVSEDVNCQFQSVRRSGNTVTWKGSCDDAEGGSQQTVSAALKSNGRLTIRYSPGGNVLANLVRCR